MALCRQAVVGRYVRKQRGRRRCLPASVAWRPSTRPRRRCC